MPYRWATGSTSFSMPRLSSEYVGCSVRKRSSPRRSETHWASTISLAGKLDVPIARTLPARTRSVSADSVSSTSVSGSGRCTW